MGRTTGARNITEFRHRSEVATSASADILHLAALKGSPLQRFRDALRHEDNFLDWIVDRHSTLKRLYVANKALAGAKRRQGPQGPKDTVFRKYWWYAEQLVLLEAINNFEVFFKQSFIELALILQELIPPDRIKGLVEARVLWSLKGDVSAPALIFEPQLFHDVENINDATRLLFGSGKTRYSSSNSRKKELIRSMRAVFQLRHTLSHNAAVVTASDAAKFRAFGLRAESGSVIDPTKDHLSTAVFRFMDSESAAFTFWLRAETISFLKDAVDERSLDIDAGKEPILRGLLGGAASDWATVTWSK